MSQTKYKLSKQRRRRCIAEIQEYDATVEWYRQKRWAILNASPKPSEVYTDHNSTGRPTEDKQSRLEWLEAHPRTVGMRAIDNALRKNYKIPTVTAVYNCNMEKITINDQNRLFRIHTSEEQV